MEVCFKTLGNHKFKLEVLDSGDVIEKCEECFKVYYHFAKNIKHVDLTKNNEQQ